jgi:predicted nucleotidyltransferase
MGAETDRLLSMEPTMEHLIQHLVARLDPVALWLFGSRTEGRERPGSDYDILAVLPDDASDEALDPVSASMRVRGLGVPVDVVPCTVAEFEVEKDEPGSLVWRVWTRGQRLYERRS